MQKTKYILIILSSYFLVSFQTINSHEYELNNLVIEFKQGVSNQEEFKELYERFDKLENEIEDYYEEEGSEESKKIYQKSRALSSLVGELSPDGRNFDLTVEKYELASSILGLSAYEHPNNNNETYCSPIAHFFLWDDSYQALILINNTSKLIKYDSKTLKAKEVATGNATESSNNGGVDCYSMRGIDGYFTTKNGILQCMTLKCETTPYCVTKK